MMQNISRISTFKISKNKIIALIIFVSIVVFTASFFIVYLSPNRKISTWQNAETITPKSLLKKVLSQKSIRHLDVSSIKVMIIPSRLSGDLYVFDFRSPQLCGAGGCLYSVYNESGHPILEFIANPYLPKKENLIQILDTNGQGFPCLLITQNTSKENIVSRSQYCYHKGQYIHLNQALTEVGKNLMRED